MGLGFFGFRDLEVWGLGGVGGLGFEGFIWGEGLGFRVRGYRGSEIQGI